MLTAANGWIIGGSETPAEVIESLSGRSAASEKCSFPIEVSDNEKERFPIDFLLAAADMFCLLLRCKLALRRGQSEQFQMQILSKCLEGVLKGYNYSPA